MFVAVVIIGVSIRTKFHTNKTIGVVSSPNHQIVETISRSNSLSSYKSEMNNSLKKSFQLNLADELPSYTDYILKSNLK